MAELRVEGGDLVLHLTGVEKAEGAHGDVTAATSPVSRLNASPEVLHVHSVLF
jgi:hypothetical protein